MAVGTWLGRRADVTLKVRKVGCETAGGSRNPPVLPRRAMFGAGNGIRTRDFDLGKVALYH